MESNRHAIAFIRENKDIFFTIFAHWGNYSSMPIRLDVSSEIEGIQFAKNIMTDEFFLEIQGGKLQQMKREKEAGILSEYFGLE